MPFQDAVRVCLQRKYVDFTGRARRSEYWFFFLFTVLASGASSTGCSGGAADRMAAPGPSRASSSLPCYSRVLP